MENELPDPELVLRAAEEEIGARALGDYFHAIHALREKKFTFREIADWLNEKFHFGVDHNAVYRAYARNVPDDVAYAASVEDDELEAEEVRRDAELNGRIVRSGGTTETNSDASNQKASKTKKRKG